MPWDRLSAAWLRPSAARPPEDDGCVVLERLTGGTGTLHLRQEGIGHRTLGPEHGERVTFGLRTRYPHDALADVAAVGFLLVVRVFAADRERDEFRRWLDEEHCVRQLTIPGVHWYLGYEEDGDAHSFLNVWSIEEPSIVDGDRWAEVRDTQRWRAVEHVAARSDRGVFRSRAA